MAARFQGVPTSGEVSMAYGAGLQPQCYVQKLHIDKSGALTRYADMKASAPAAAAAAQEAPPGSLLGKPPFVSAGAGGGGGLGLAQDDRVRHAGMDFAQAAEDLKLALGNYLAYSEGRGCLNSYVGTMVEQTTANLAQRMQQAPPAPAAPPLPQGLLAAHGGGLRGAEDVRAVVPSSPVGTRQPLEFLNQLKDSLGHLACCLEQRAGGQPGMGQPPLSHQLQLLQQQQQLQQPNVLQLCAALEAPADAATNLQPGYEPSQLGQAPVPMQCPSPEAARKGKAKGRKAAAVPHEVPQAPLQRQPQHQQLVQQLSQQLAPQTQFQRQQQPAPLQHPLLPDVFDTDKDGLGCTLRMHLEWLLTVDSQKVLVVRKINRLGFASTGLLQAFGEQFGAVEKVLVAHSKVNSKAQKHGRDAAEKPLIRLRPASMGFLVMCRAEDADVILRCGEEQVIGGYVVQVQPYHRRLVEDSSLVDMEAAKMENLGAFGTAGYAPTLAADPASMSGLWMGS